MRNQVLTLAAVCLGLTLPPVPIAGGCRAFGSPGQESPKKAAKRSTSLRMSPGVVCRSIDGYEDYEPLPGAAQTSEEKLLVYVRPLGFKTKLTDGEYEAHLIPDFEIRKRGEKKILRQKQRMYEYKPRSPEPTRRIYLKNVIALKGLQPGEYDLTIILHDEIAGEPPATQVIKFRIIPPGDPRKENNEPTGSAKAGE